MGRKGPVKRTAVGLSDDAPIMVFGALRKRRHLLGTRVGRMTVLKKLPTKLGKKQFWLCHCDACGRDVERTTSHLTRSSAKTCGCVGNRTHGKTHSSEYNSWATAKQRCHTPTSSKYQWYGARGISMCEAWRDSFATFIAYVGPRPSPKHSLDRIDVNGNYEPGNVRWATRVEQRNNQRTSEPRVREVLESFRSRDAELVDEITRVLFGE